MEQQELAINDRPADGNIRLSGSVERIVYRNIETGQCLLDIKLKAQPSHILISTFSHHIFPGTEIDIDVLLSEQQKFFLFTEGLSISGIIPGKNLSLHLPSTERTLRKFLKSGPLGSIGPNLAKNIAKDTNKNFFSLLENDPGQLTKVEGIGTKRLKSLTEKWSEYKLLDKMKDQFANEGLPLNWCDILLRGEGLECLNYFLKNPFEASIKYQLDFDLIDMFAMNRGANLSSESRIRAALYSIMHAQYKLGHCAYPEGKILEELQTKLDLTFDQIEEILEYEIVKEELILEKIQGVDCLYLRKVWERERKVADKLISLKHQSTKSAWINFNKTISWAQEVLDLKLAPLQCQAIEVALSSALTVITGGPGTGKTTLIRALVTILQAQSSRFALCSPTGRAAQRLQEATLYPAKTIHRLLKYDGENESFVHNLEKPLEVDFVLIDEMSMVDLDLMASLLDALPRDCSLVLIGDSDQIPPVGAGNILQSIIDSKCFSVVKLTDIFRHHEESYIRKNAVRINSGLMPFSGFNTDKDFHYMPLQNSDDIKRILKKLVTDTIPNEFGIRDLNQLQVLVPMNSGIMGTQHLNSEIKKWLHKSKSGSIGFENQYSLGDKVMVTKNNYQKEIFNGDIGFIEKISYDGQYIDINFNDRLVRFDFEEIDCLTLAYAITIHKSQGSEYRATVIIVTNEHLPMAQKHLIYTAITRGKEHVFLIADPNALQTAIQSDENNRRWQNLTALLSIDC